MADRYFPKVKEAREFLMSKAQEIAELQLKVARDAAAAQDFESANEALKHLSLHMPKDAEGNSMLESSVDNVKVLDKGSGPTIKIGVAIGGLPKRDELPPVQVIEVKDE